jgi:hypothetical protein
LRSQTGGVVHRRLPNHPARRASNQPQHLHGAQVYFALRNYPLNSPRRSRREKNSHSYRRFWRRT